MIRNSLLLTVAFAMFALFPLCRAQDLDQEPPQTQEPPQIQEPAQGQELGQPGIDSAIAALRASLQADRATIICTAMNLNDKDSEAFWPIYRQYEYERSILDDSRVAIIKEYTQKNANLTDAEAKAMAERMFDYDSRLTVLKKKYFKRFNKVLPAFTVAKFFQLDRRIDLMMDMKVESSLPPLTQAQYATHEK